MNSAARASMTLVLFAVLAACTGDRSETEFPALTSTNNEIARKSEAAARGSLPEAVPAPPAVAAPGAGPFLEGVEHEFVALRSGTVWVYEGTHNGSHRRDDVRVLDAPRTIAGVSCVSIQQQVRLDGVLHETTTEWFAQDAQGNVWKFGEESLEFDGVRFAVSADSWESGVNGAEAWMFLPVEPRVGDLLIGSRADGHDLVEVVSLASTAIVPFGTFFDCLEVIENEDDPDDTDIILYAPGVGAVSETSPSGHLHLVEWRRE